MVSPASVFVESVTLSVAQLTATSAAESKLRATSGVADSLREDDFPRAAWTARKTEGPQFLKPGTEAASSGAADRGIEQQRGVWSEVAGARASAPGPSENAQQILRAHFAKEILRSLEQLADCAGEPIAARYAGTMLRAMRTLRDINPYDPYVEVAMALHDALAFENRWLGVPAERYRGALDVLKKLHKLRRIDNTKAEKAIVDLEEIGFDTTPFAAELTEDTGSDD